MKIVWSGNAADDLAQIVDYIADDDASAALRVAKTIFEGVMSLETMPHRGRKRNADSSRELVFGPWPYVVLYEVVGNAVHIKGIRHTSQDWRD